MDVNNNEKSHKLNIAVIGAGVAGLVSAKQSLGHGYNVTVFEQECELGGIWFYTDEIGKNKFGHNIHTSSYKNLMYIPTIFTLRSNIFSLFFLIEFTIFSAQI